MKDHVVDNFISTLDMSLPMIAHFQNAMRDAMIYKWPSNVLIAIMSGIEDAYNKMPET